MANINVVVDRPIADGYKLKFRTPCDSTTIEGLEVKCPVTNGVGYLIKKFVFKDAHGTELSGVGNLFVSGVMIEVLLDVTHSVAYIQNADTNSYVESVKGEVQRLQESQRQFLGVAGKAVEECEKAVEECEKAVEECEKATNTLVLTHDDVVSGGYIEALKELNIGDKFSFWVGTQAEYDALETKPVNTFCIVTDDTTADDISAAIVELQERANANAETLTNHYLQIVDIQSTNDTQGADIDRLENAIDSLREETGESISAAIDGLREETGDYIVEQGVDEDTLWRYRKWASGVAECWGKAGLVGAFTSEWGCLYGLPESAGRKHLPISFAKRPIEIVTARGETNGCFVFAESGSAGMNSTNETADYNVARPVMATEEQYIELQYYVIGEWE